MITNKVRLGYCCINLSLSNKKITANRGMIRKTFQQRGAAYAGELALLNLQDLLRILEWNLANDIFVYRMSSDIFPWMSEYEIEQLPNFNELRLALSRIGEFARQHNMRLSMHPGQFDVLPSPNPAVVTKTVKDLNQHAQIMDLMGLPCDYNFPINIHVGGTYGDKPSAAARFIMNFGRLSESAQRRLVVENDDKAAQYSVADLYSMIFMNIGVPITFDFHHHRFNTGDLTEEQALALAASTWPCTPLTHYSSCKKTFEDKSVIARSHADYVYEKIKDYGLSFDCEIEAKAKDLAVIKYRQTSESLLENYREFDDIIVLENV